IKLHHKVYGQSSLDKFHPISSNGLSTDPTDENKDNSGVLNESDILLETPEALALQKTQAELRTKLKNPPTRTKEVKSLPRGPSQQIETRSKDGRRRITPKFLGHLDSPDDDGNSNPQFTSPQPSRSESKSSLEIVSDSASDSSKAVKTTTSSTIVTAAAAVTGMISATTMTTTTTTATATTNTTIITTTTSSTTSTTNTTVPKTVTSASNSSGVTVVAVNGTTGTNSNKNNSNNSSSNINKQPTSQVNHPSVSKNTTIETKRGDETVSVSNTDVSLNQKNVSSKTVPSGVQAPSTTTIPPPPQQQQQPLVSKKSSSESLEQEIGIEQKRARLDTNDSEPPAQVDNAKLISDESAKVNPSSKQRKRRVRLFTEEEKSPKSGAEATSASSKSSAVQNNKKVCFSPESSPQQKPKSVTISIPEPTDNISSTIHTASTVFTNPPPFIITTPDQLASVPKVQFVCSNLIDGPIVVQLINSSYSSSTCSEEGTKMPASISRICANRGDRRLWELVSSDRLTSYAYSDEVIVVGDSKGRIQLLYSTGGRICPNLLLDSVHTLVLTNETAETGHLSTSSSSSGKSAESSGSNNNSHLSRLHAVVSGNEQQQQQPPQRTTLPHNGGPIGATNAFNGNNNNINKFNMARKYRLAALCRSGRLIIWNFSLTNSGLGSVSSIFNATVFPQILVEANIKDILNGGHNSRFNSLSFGPNGYPVVYLQDNSSYLFHIESRIWIELFDASDTARYQFAVNVARGSPPGPLSACQQLSKIVNSGGKLTSSTGSNSSLISASSRRISNQNFLESQTQLALAFGSSNEYRYWLTRWFRQLIEDISMCSTSSTDVVEFYDYNDNDRVLRVSPKVTVTDMPNGPVIFIVLLSEQFSC
ncbi:unnamed protein product, partial [Trichobilharzia szidati]